MMSIRLIENLATKSSMSLTDFCVLLSARIELPPFTEDGENETEWAEAGNENFSVNISRPYDSASLHKWDEKVPLSYNFDVNLKVGNMAPVEWNHEWMVREIIPQYAKIIANICQHEVIYVRQWPSSTNFQRVIFRPDGNNKPY